MKFAFAPESKPLDGYTIKRAIHRGGFGEVYYALSDAGKEVALKLLHNNLEVELRGVSQCLNLKHPNLVTIFDMKQDSEKDHWIVMEYVGGKGLYEIMQEHPAGMPLKDVLFWMSGITAGLSFLHDRGLVHRDLKPANIFCDADIVKIGDVGLSKYISDSRRSAQTQSVGTVYYMAPEVARGRYGREVDVYSTGVILYEMLTGRVPFEGETTAEILMKHLTAEPDLSIFPEKLRPVLAAALEKDPDRRISDIEELNRRFREAVQESGAPMEKPTPVFKSAPVDRRRSAQATAPTVIGRVGADSASSRSGVADAYRSFVELWERWVPAPVTVFLVGVVVLGFLNRGIAAFQTIGRTQILIAGILTAYLFFRKRWHVAETASAQPATSPEIPRNATAQQAVRPSPAASAPTATKTAPAVAPVQPVVHRHAVVSPGKYTPLTLRQIPFTQRAIDVSTSLTLSLAAVFLVTAAVHLATPLLPGIVDVAFFGTVTLMASACLIVLAKLWEGKAADNLLRRLIQGSVGLGVGAVAYSLQQFLLLSHSSLLHAEGDGIFRGRELGRISVINDHGLPTMAGFMIFFGLLFLARRWWWQADSFRKSRFRISSTLFSLLIGFILTAILPFPGNLGATWALAISAVVQLSAGWTPQEERLLAPAPDPHPASPVLAQVRHPTVATPMARKLS